MGAFTGTFDNSVNNNNMTLTASGNAFNGSGTGTRTIKLGTATYTLSNNAGSVTFGTSSNLTYSGNTGCTWSFTGTGQQVFTTGSGLSHGNISIGARSGTGYFTINNASTTTFNSFAMTAPARVAFNIFTTTTVTTALALAGSSSNQLGLLCTSTGGSATLAVAAGSTIAWAGIEDMTFTGSPTATNSFNLGNNSGITITGPSGGGGGGSGAGFSATIF